MLSIFPQKDLLNILILKNKYVYTYVIKNLLQLKHLNKQFI